MGRGSRAQSASTPFMPWRPCPSVAKLTRHGMARRRGNASGRRRRASSCRGARSETRVRSTLSWRRMRRRNSASKPAKPLPTTTTRGIAAIGRLLSSRSVAAIVASPSAPRSGAHGDPQSCRGHPHGGEARAGATLRARYDARMAKPERVLEWCIRSGGSELATLWVGVFRTATSGETNCSLWNCSKATDDGRRRSREYPCVRTWQARRWSQCQRNRLPSGFR